MHFRFVICSSPSFGSSSGPSCCARCCRRRSRLGGRRQQSQPQPQAARLFRPTYRLHCHRRQRTASYQTVQPARQTWSRTRRRILLRVGTACPVQEAASSGPEGPPGTHPAHPLTAPSGAPQRKCRPTPGKVIGPHPESAERSPCWFDADHCEKPLRTREPVTHMPAQVGIAAGPSQLELLISTRLIFATNQA